MGGGDEFGYWSDKVFDKTGEELPPDNPAPVPLTFGEPRNGVTFAAPLAEPAKEDIPKGAMVFLNTKGEAVVKDERTGEIVPAPREKAIKPGDLLPSPLFVGRAASKLHLHERIKELEREVQRLRASSPEDIRAAGYKLYEYTDSVGGDGREYRRWQLYRPGGPMVVGIDMTDAAALNKIREQIGIPVISTE